MIGHRKAAAALVLALCMSSCSAPSSVPYQASASAEAGDSQKIESESQRFSEFLDEEFLSYFETDYVSTHFAMNDPSAFGIDTSEQLKCISQRPDPEVFEETRQALLESQERFQTFDRALLSEEQQDLYDAYAFQLELSLALSDKKFDYYTQLFETSAGIHSGIAMTLADWDLRSEQDVRDLIAVVNDVLPYVKSALYYTRQQAELGLLMTDSAEVIEYCNGVLSAGLGSTVLSALCERIEELGLEEADAQAYCSELTQAFSTSFLPAYREMAQTLRTLQAQGAIVETGLANLPLGREYYELLLRANTGADWSAEQVRERMEEAASRHIDNIANLLAQNSRLSSLIAKGLPKTGFESYVEILDFLREHMAEDFPAVENLDYVVSDMDEETASVGVAAYFLIPPVDGENVNRLYVNPQYGNVGDLSTFSTVAHEGYPGHMYQHAFLDQSGACLWNRRLCDNPAYTEGYATYVELEVLDYLDGYDDALLAMYRESDLLDGCYLVLADIGIHYDGWTYEEFSDFSRKFGAAPMQELYRQLQANPCMFVPYYVGCEEILAMRDDAEQALGDGFTEMDFHTALLQGGALPFDVVQSHMDEWIALSPAA